MDAAVTHKIYTLMMPQIQEDPALWRLFNTITMPMARSLVYIVYHGVQIDVALMDDVTKESKEALQSSEQDLFQFCGREFNWKSTAQLQDVLFKQFQLPVIKSTKTGPSTDAEVLEMLQDKSPVVRKILTVRGAAKALTLLSGEGGLRKYLDKTNRIHCHYHIHGTRNGRLSSSEPNLQSIPMKGSARLLFTVPKNHYLIEADYDQAEYRVAAFLSQDPVLLDIFETGKDIHRDAASGVFKVPYESVDDDQRYLAKFINFGLLYGRGSDSLAAQFSLTKEEAAKYVRNYFARYALLYRWMQDTQQQALTEGYLRNMFGRVRRFPGHREGAEWVKADIARQAVNFPCASTVSDFLSSSTITLQLNRFKARKMKTNIVLTFHDALYFETPAEELEDVIDMAGTVMTAPRGGLSLPVKMVVSTRWLTKEAMKHEPGVRHISVPSVTSLVRTG